MKNFKKWPLAITVSAGILLTACSSDSANGDAKNASAEGESSSGEVQKIVVGTSTQFPQICFIDENGELTGYDIEIVRAIDEKLPEYEFEFNTMDFTNLIISLETDKIDFVAHQMEVNEEREEKFLFNKEPYNIFPLKVVVHQDNDEIQSIEDLAGKTFSAPATSNSAIFFENYKKDTGIDTEMLYAPMTTIINDLNSGRVDATIETPFSVDIYNNLNDAQLKAVGDTLLNSETFFLFNKDNEELAQSIDEALVELKEEGVVKELSEKWLGADYSF